MKRREEMGKEQLDRTKRFTDDGKMRGIISSSKFVPACSGESEFIGFGELFKARGRTNEEADRELIIVDDSKVVKKRKITEVLEEVRDYPPESSIRWGENSISRIPLDSGAKKQKRSKIVILKIPKLGQINQTLEAKQPRRVHFADV